MPRVNQEKAGIVEIVLVAGDEPKAVLDFHHSVSSALTVGSDLLDRGVDGLLGRAAEFSGGLFSSQDFLPYGFLELFGCL